MSCRETAKQRPVADWPITRITGKGARYLGQSKRPMLTRPSDVAIKKFEIDAEHQSRVAVRPIGPR